MDVEILRAALAGLVSQIEFFEQTDSTNRVAREWAGAGAPEKAIVVADYQTAGRGRFDRTWFAPPGECLLFSLVLRPRCQPEEAPLVNLAAAVALSRAIEHERLEARVKWPNDVLITGRKTAGILSEVVSTGSRPDTAGQSLAVVLGVGVNVNVREFPAELATTATSLLLEAARPVDRIGLLRRFLEHLAGLYESFPAGVVDAYVPLSDVLGRQVHIELAEGTIEGKAEAIDSLGNLVLDSGKVISVGDVGYLAG